MSDINAKGGELRATLHITRKATGKVETLEIVGHTTPEQHAVIVRTMKKKHVALGAMTGQGSSMSNDPTKE